MQVPLPPLLQRRKLHLLMEVLLTQQLVAHTISSMTRAFTFAFSSGTGLWQTERYLLEQDVHAEGIARSPLRKLPSHGWMQNSRAGSLCCLLGPYADTRVIALGALLSPP